LENSKKNYQLNSKHVEEYKFTCHNQEKKDSNKLRDMNLHKNDSELVYKCNVDKYN